MKQEKNKYQLDYRIKPLVFGWIRSQKNDQVKEYFKRHPNDIYLKAWMSDTPLHIACLSGNFEIVKYLVEHHADVNAQRTGVYATPLCWASHVEIAEYLLDHGATMNNLELSMATKQDKLHIIDLLLEKGAKISKSNPQYLACKSKEAINVYLKHQVDLNGCDEGGQNLLHKLAWLDLEEVFDFALKIGIIWKKDKSRRTPFISAREGGRNRIVHHLSENYPELISNQIKKLELNLAFERISFLISDPTNLSGYIALTEEGKLIGYEIKESDRLVVNKAIEMDVFIVRNFTIDPSGNLIIPTGENKLLKIDSRTFELIETIIFDQDNNFDQISYLPKRGIYIGSSNNWEIILLNEDFSIIHKIEAEDGTFAPVISADERLVSFLSYDHETFFDLYEIKDDHKVRFVHTFFEDQHSISKSFAFMGNTCLVAYPKKIEALKLAGDNLVKIQELNIEAYEASFNACSLTAISDKCFLFAKGKRLVVYEKMDKIHKIEEIHLSLKDEVRKIHFDHRGKNLIIMTNSEIRTIDLNGKSIG